MAGLYSKTIPSIASNRRVFAFLITVFVTISGCESGPHPVPKTASDHIKSGNTFLNVGLFEAAKKEFEQAKKLNPLSEQAQIGLFKATLFAPIEKHDYGHNPDGFDQRIKCFLEEHPNDPHALICLGQCYFTTAPDTAKKYLDQAIAQNGSIAAAYYVKGGIYACQDSFDQALEMYEQADKLLPDGLARRISELNRYYLAKKYEATIARFHALFKNDTLLSALCAYSNACRVQDTLSSALFAQERLIKLLEDTSVVSLKKNRGPWMVPIAYNVVSLNSYSQKKLYAYYNLAFTYYLMAVKYNMREYVNEAEKYAPQLVSNDDAAVKKIVNFDIERLLEKRKKDGREYKQLEKIIKQVEAFRKKFNISSPLGSPPTPKTDGSEWIIRLSTHRLRANAYEFKKSFKQKHQVIMNEVGLSEDCIKIDRVKNGESYFYCVQLRLFGRNQAAEAYDKLRLKHQESKLIEQCKGNKL